MDISAVELFLFISVAINFFLLNKVSNKKASRYFYEKILDLENKLQKNKEHIENINFHHASLSQSIIYHLHASGVAHISRVWKTYQVEVKAEWPYDEKKWPNYLPIEGNPEYSSSNLDKEHYSKWLLTDKNKSYYNNPDKVVDYDYVYAMDRW